MKTASKVFVIISIVFACLELFAGFICLSVGFGDIGAFALIWGLIVLLISICALSELNKARKHSDLVVIGVLTMIFCSFLAGLLMLLIKDEELQSDLEEDEENEHPSPYVYVGNTTGSYSPANDEEVTVTYCVYCGGELYDDDIFCGNCGKPTRNICPECDSVNNPQDKFCRNCGHELKEQ